MNLIHNLIIANVAYLIKSKQEIVKNIEDKDIINKIILLSQTYTFFEDMFKINGLEVNNGDVVVIKNRFNVELVNKKIVKQ